MGERDRMRKGSKEGQEKDCNKRLKSERSQKQKKYGGNCETKQKMRVEGSGDSKERESLTGPCQERLERVDVHRHPG